MTVDLELNNAALVVRSSEKIIPLIQTVGIGRGDETLLN